MAWAPTYPRRDGKRTIGAVRTGRPESSPHLDPLWSREHASVSASVSTRGALAAPDAALAGCEIVLRPVACGSVAELKGLGCPRHLGSTQTRRPRGGTDGPTEKYSVRLAWKAALVAIGIDWDWRRCVPGMELAKRERASS